MQFFSADATIFSKTFGRFFCPRKLEKTTLKSCSEKLKSTFFPHCQHSPNGPNRKIHVPKCGLQANCIQNWGMHKKRKQVMLTWLSKKSECTLNFIDILFQIEIGFQIVWSFMQMLSPNREIFQSTRNLVVLKITLVRCCC